jgi:hypothetical protein
MKHTEHRDVIVSLNGGLIAHPIQVEVAGLKMEDRRKLRNKLKALRKRWRKA